MSGGWVCCSGEREREGGRERESEGLQREREGERESERAGGWVRNEGCLRSGGSDGCRNTLATREMRKPRLRP